MMAVYNLRIIYDITFYKVNFTYINILSYFITLNAIKTQTSITNLSKITNL